MSANLSSKQQQIDIATATAAAAVAEEGIIRGFLQLIADLSGSTYFTLQRPRMVKLFEAIMDILSRGGKISYDVQVGGFHHELVPFCNPDKFIREIDRHSGLTDFNVMHKLIIESCVKFIVAKQDNPALEFKMVLVCDGCHNVTSIPDMLNAMVSSVLKSPEIREVVRLSEGKKPSIMYVIAPAYINSIPEVKTLFEAFQCFFKYVGFAVGTVELPLPDKDGDILDNGVFRDKFINALKESSKTRSPLEDIKTCIEARTILPEEMQGDPTDRIDTIMAELTRAANANVLVYLPTGDITIDELLRLVLQNLSLDVLSVMVDSYNAQKVLDALLTKKEVHPKLSAEGLCLEKIREILTGYLETLGDQLRTVIQHRDAVRIAKALYFGDDSFIKILLCRVSYWKDGVNEVLPYAAFMDLIHRGLLSIKSHKAVLLPPPEIAGAFFPMMHEFISEKMLNRKDSADYLRVLAHISRYLKESLKTDTQSDFLEKLKRMTDLCETGVAATWSLHVKWLANWLAVAKKYVHLSQGSTQPPGLELTNFQRQSLIMLVGAIKYSPRMHQYIADNDLGSHGELIGATLMMLAKISADNFTFEDLQNVKINIHNLFRAISVSHPDYSERWAWFLLIVQQNSPSKSMESQLIMSFCLTFCIRNIGDFAHRFSRLLSAVEQNFAVATNDTSKTIYYCWARSFQVESIALTAPRLAEYFELQEYSNLMTDILPYMGGAGVGALFTSPLDGKGRFTPIQIKLVGETEEFVSTELFKSFLCELREAWDLFNGIHDNLQLLPACAVDDRKALHMKNEICNRCLIPFSLPKHNLGFSSHKCNTTTSYSCPAGLKAVGEFVKGILENAGKTRDFMAILKGLPEKQIERFDKSAQDARLLLGDTFEPTFLGIVKSLCKSSSLASQLASQEQLFLQNPRAKADYLDVFARLILLYGLTKPDPTGKTPAQIESANKAAEEASKLRAEAFKRQLDDKASEFQSAAEALQRVVLALSKHVDDALKVELAKVHALKAVEAEYSRVEKDHQIINIFTIPNCTKKTGIVLSLPVIPTLSAWCGLPEAKRSEFKELLEGIRARAQKIDVMLWTYSHKDLPKFEIDVGELRYKCTILAGHGVKINLPPIIRKQIPLAVPLVDPSDEALAAAFTVPKIEDIPGVAAIVAKIDAGMRLLAEVEQMSDKYSFYSYRSFCYDRLSEQINNIADVVKYPVPPNKPTFKPGTPLDVQYKVYTQLQPELKSYEDKLKSAMDTIAKIEEQLYAINPDQLYLFASLAKDAFRAAVLPSPPAHVFVASAASGRVLPISYKQLQEHVAKCTEYKANVNRVVVNGLRGSPRYMQVLKSCKQDWDSPEKQKIDSSIREIHARVPKLKAGVPCPCGFVNCTGGNLEE